MRRVHPGLVTRYKVESDLGYVVKLGSRLQNRSHSPLRVLGPAAWKLGCNFALTLVAAPKGAAKVHDRSSEYQAYSSARNVHPRDRTTIPRHVRV